MKNVILASQSPRRHELLDRAGIKHKILVSGADEDSVEYVPGHPEELAVNTATLKNASVRAVVEKSGSDCDKNSVILSADTVVYSPDSLTVFGKPADTDEAFSMLRSLSGRAHRVVTGVVLYDVATEHEVTFVETTEVFFRPLSDDEIRNYIRVYRPLDKAGAYGIQDGSCIFVEKIVGDYYNVVGLPICHVYTELMKL